MQEPIIIVGAGVSGLYAASLLTQQGIPCKVVESRERIGGRVLSVTVPGEEHLGRFDLGPTWFWPQYEPKIEQLVKKLQLQTFVQRNDGDLLVERFQTKPPERCVMQENTQERGVRITGGIQSLIEALAKTIPSTLIELHTRVKKVRLTPEGNVTVMIEKADKKIEWQQAPKVIFALPPRLLAKHIEFSPELPRELLEDLKEKPTWMGSQAKAIAIYNQPFWRDSGLSGLVLSSAGPLQEIYDASPLEGTGALFGFFGISSEVRQQMGQEKVEQLVTKQLGKLFGQRAENPLAILYKDWSNDEDTAVLEDSHPIKNYTSYGQPTITGPWKEKIIFAGTETNAHYSGHLEGALESAAFAVDKIGSLPIQ